MKLVYTRSSFRHWSSTTNSSMDYPARVYLNVPDDIAKSWDSMGLVDVLSELPVPVVYGLDMKPVEVKSEKAEQAKKSPSKPKDKAKAKGE